MGLSHVPRMGFAPLTQRRRMISRRVNSPIALAPSRLRAPIPTLTEAGRIGLLNDSRPVLRQPALPNIAMERREWPMAHARNETVLDWIVMDVVHVPVQIHFVADRVLPETALPQRILAASIALDRQPTRDDVAAE